MIKLTANHGPLNADLLEEADEIVFRNCTRWTEMRSTPAVLRRYVALFTLGPSLHERQLYWRGNPVVADEAIESGRVVFVRDGTPLVAIENVAE